MKSFTIFSVLVAAAASVLGQTISVGAPIPGQILTPGEDFTAQINLPESIEGCTQVGIALAINTCTGGVCPAPADALGDVLYAGPWSPTAHNPGGFYQNFTLQCPTVFGDGPAVFTLTHLCLLGAAPYPFLEFRTVNVTIGSSCT